MEEKLKCTNSSTAYSPTLPPTHTYPENDNVEINHLKCVLNMFFKKQTGRKASSPKKKDPDVTVSKINSIWGHMSSE